MYISYKLSHCDIEKPLTFNTSPSGKKFVVIDCEAEVVGRRYITDLCSSDPDTNEKSFCLIIFCLHVSRPLHPAHTSSAHSSQSASFKLRTSCPWTQAEPPILTLKSCSSLKRRRSMTPKSTRKRWTLSSMRHLYSRWVLSVCEVIKYCCRICCCFPVCTALRWIDAAVNRKRGTHQTFMDDSEHLYNMSSTNNHPNPLPASPSHCVSVIGLAGSCQVSQDVCTHWSVQPTVHAAFSCPG